MIRINSPTRTPHCHPTIRHMLGATDMDVIRELQYLLSYSLVWARGCIKAYPARIGLIQPLLRLYLVNSQHFHLILAIVLRLFVFAQFFVPFAHLLLYFYFCCRAFLCYYEMVCTQNRLNIGYWMKSGLTENKRKIKIKQCTSPVIIRFGLV